MKLIIEKPELQSPVHRYGWDIVTLGFWGLYLYLWLPLVTMVAWWVGFKLFHLHMIDLQGYVGVMHKAGFYGLIILSISTILITWARIERYRFKDKSRRGDAVRADDLDAGIAGLASEQILAMRQQKVTVVDFSQKGLVSGIYNR